MFSEIKTTLLVAVYSCLFYGSLLYIIIEYVHNKIY